MKSPLTILPLALLLTVGLPPLALAIDDTINVRLEAIKNSSDRGLYISKKQTPLATFRPIEDIQRDFLSSKGIFDRNIDFSAPVDNQRVTVVVYSKEYEVKVAE